MNAVRPSLHERNWNAVAVHSADNVAVAMRSLKAGNIAVRIGQTVQPLTLTEPVGIGHKIALRAIAEGEEVKKYGEIIGVATKPITAGTHVHVHNIKSRRAQTNRAKV
jgi:hypothetical protein